MSKSRKHLVIVESFIEIVSLDFLTVFNSATLDVDVVDQALRDVSIIDFGSSLLLSCTLTLLIDWFDHLNFLFLN